MKIVHICLGNFYIDNYSYQENMLTKYHKELGFEVEIIASLESFDKNGDPCLLPKAGMYLNEHGIPVTRLKYKSKMWRKLRRYNGTYEAIVRSNPDILFIHGCQFLDIDKVVKYLQKNPKVEVYVDNHADYSNSARNFLSKNILHKIIWKRCAYSIEPYTKKFYGVLPARVAFLKKVYKLPTDKVELLLMGADDQKVKEARSYENKINMRNKLGIKEDDFLIITGGKIDSSKKQTLLLMDAVNKINNPKVKLIIFGSVTEELKTEFFNKIDGEFIKYLGWVEGEDSYKYFGTADLAVFPGRHSVFWEQVVGLGIPAFFKYWEGTTHVDLGGNCHFLFKDDVEEIKSKLEEIIGKPKMYKYMKTVAQEKGMKFFSYLEIAKKSVEID